MQSPKAQPHHTHRSSDHRSSIIESSTSAFTLLEMSIVIAIIGLLTGGVLVGKSMYRNAKLQEVTSRMAELGSKVKTFVDTYNYLPGDMPTATTIWGAAHATPATCVTTNSLTLTDIRATCNGNGNGRVQDVADSEVFRGYQQLANAGLLEGRYTGVAGSGGTVHHIPGTNSPIGTFPGSGYRIANPGLVGGTTTVFYLPYDNAIQYGMATTTANPIGAVFSGKEQYQIDSKIDDGLPHRGNILALNDLTNCTNASSFASPAWYMTPEQFAITYQQGSAIVCTIIMRNAW